MSRHWPALPQQEGEVQRQAHADLPPGTVEREAGREGFFGPATHFLHPRPPTGWTAIEGPLQPRAFDTHGLASAAVACPWDAPLLLHNAQLRVRRWEVVADMPALARNADGDDLLFVHAGEGALYCDYGHLRIEHGDYVLIPRGTQWRLTVSSPLSLLMIEASNGAYQLPDRGLLGPHAQFDPAVMDRPRLDAAFKAQGDAPCTVAVKRQEQITRVHFPHNPLDAVGWHGALYPLRLNVRDIRPIMSDRYHVPPSAHTTFVAAGFVVCTFVPRPFETDPGALKVPFFHNNDDYDEVIFYHAGDFFSRDGIGPGMMTLHPAGLTHGPHPKALTRMFQQEKRGTDEYAVMIDSRSALNVTDAASAIERPGYALSWRA